MISWYHRLVRTLKILANSDSRMMTAKYVLYHIDVRSLSKHHSKLLEIPIFQSMKILGFVLARLPLKAQDVL